MTPTTADLKETQVPNPNNLPDLFAPDRATEQQRAMINMATFELDKILKRQHNLTQRSLLALGQDCSYFNDGRAEAYRAAQCDLAEAHLEENLDLVDAFIAANITAQAVAAQFLDGIGGDVDMLPELEILN